jgi:TfoX/Sxy family transcriptional regulator of competence genes
MGYNENLAHRIRRALNDSENLVEKKMFGGIAFMINDKMCIGVSQDNIMLRCEKEETDELLRLKGAKVFDLSGGRPMKGWILVGLEGIESEMEFRWWLDKAMEGNRNASIAKKKKPAESK